MDIFLNTNILVCIALVRAYFDLYIYSYVCGFRKTKETKIVDDMHTIHLLTYFIYIYIY